MQINAAESTIKTSESISIRIEALSIQLPIKRTHPSNGTVNHQIKRELKLTSQWNSPRVQ